MGCWLWTGYLSNGYGHFWGINNKWNQAHRFAYEQLVGKIPKGMDLDHLCRIRNCVNPKHLEPVTRQENLKRGKTGGFRKNSAPDWQLAKTHCPKGHPLFGDNVYYRPKPKGRVCRQCHRERTRLLRAKKDAEI